MMSSARGSPSARDCFCFNTVHVHLKKKKMLPAPLHMQTDGSVSNLASAVYAFPCWTTLNWKKQRQTLKTKVK